MPACPAGFFLQKSRMTYSTKEANIGRGIVFPGRCPLEEVDELEELQKLYTANEKACPLMDEAEKAKRESDRRTR